MALLEQKDPAGHARHWGPDWYIPGAQMHWARALDPKLERESDGHGVGAVEPVGQ